MDTCETTQNASPSSPGWCFVCNVSLTPETANEHYESRTHLNKCLQKGVGISVVPSSERSSTWCSICNHALDSASAAEQHYESRAHMNKCLQKGVGIPLSYASSAAIMPPAAPRFTHAGSPTSPQGGATGCSPSGSFTNFRPGTQRVRPRAAFQQGNQKMAYGGKKFPMQQSILCGQMQSNSQMSVPYGGGYGQEMRSSDTFKQYDNSWQNQSSVKNGWPYCETCDQRFQTVGALSQHCSSSSHLEMKAMKQNQFRGGHAQGDQSRFYQGASGHIRAQGPNQGTYYGNQVATQQEPFRNPVQNQGTHYLLKEWCPYNRHVQYYS